MPMCGQYFEAQSHTPFDCCVRFVVVVTFHAATLATRRTLLLTWTGLAPAGSRQLLLAHHHILLAGLPALSLTLRPVESLSRPRRPLSRGSGPASYPAKPLVSYQSYRQLSGWILPPLVKRALGAHRKMLDSFQ